MKTTLLIQNESETDAPVFVPRIRHDSRVEITVEDHDIEHLVDIAAAAITAYGGLVGPLVKAEIADDRKKLADPWAAPGEDLEGGVESVDDTAAAFNSETVGHPDDAESSNHASFARVDYVSDAADLFEAGPKPLARVVELLGEIDLGASPEQIAGELNIAGIRFIQRKES